MTAVRESWEERLASLRDECGFLEGALSKVAKEMGETETAVKNSFGAMKKGDRR